MLKSYIEYITLILFIHLEYIQIDLFIFVGGLVGKSCCCFFKCINCLSFFIFVYLKHFSLMELINDMYGEGRDKLESFVFDTL